MLDRIFGGLPWPPQFFIPGCFCCDAATPLPRLGHVCATINNCMHAVSGVSDATNWMSENSKYNPGTASWSTDVPLAVGCRSAAMCSVSNSLYLFTGEQDQPGSDFVARTEKFDGSAWTTKTDAPAPLRARSSASSVSYLAYMFGGINTLANNIGDNDEYNPVADSWVSRTNLPLPNRSYAATFVVSGAIYLAGGDTNLNDVDQYIPDTWTSKTSVAAPTRGGQAVGNQLTASGTGTMSNAGYITCGRSNVPLPLQDHDEYIAASDSWTGKTDCPLPARFNVAGSSVLGDAYICGGSDGISKLADTDSYQPDTWTSRADMV
jgi:hypothetical protein